MAVTYVSLFALSLLTWSALCDKSAEQIQYQRHDANSDACLQQDEFSSIFMAMDTHPKDGKLSVSEMIDGWHHFHFHDYRDASFFFMEVDRDRDAFVTKSDLTFLYSTFDTNNDACLTYDEYTMAWQSLFRE